MLLSILFLCGCGCEITNTPRQVVFEKYNTTEIVEMFGKNNLLVRDTNGAVWVCDVRLSLSLDKYYILTSTLLFNTNKNL